MENARVIVERATERERREQEKRTAGAAKRIAIERTAALHRRTGVHRFLLEKGLALVAFALFALTFAGQIAAGHAVHNEQQAQHGDPPVSVAGYLATSRFWFESLQNWQSEFLAVGVLVVLSIWLREQGSPQSKPVGAGVRETGE
jgi:hypothetical protein